jgi:O-antigen/teichoic acid export membrane protein
MTGDDPEMSNPSTTDSSATTTIGTLGDSFSPGGETHDHHFATDHLLPDLRGRTVSGGFVAGVAQMVQFGLNLTSTIVLARLLVPQDFGLVAMVMTVTGFLRMFHDAGLATATVQREGITHTQVSNLFWANVMLGGLASLLLAAFAPAIAWFYREPRLVGITLVICLTFVLTSPAAQHWAILKRQMRFKMIAAIQVAAIAVGVFVGIGMAWLHWGYWSLVGLQLSSALTALLLTWTASHWRPQLPKRSSGTLSLLSFGANLSVSNFIWSLARGCDGLLIGRFYGSASLGFYSRGGALLARPIDQFMAPLEAVFVPTLSRLQVQPERYRRIVLQVYETIALVTFLCTGLLLPLAHPLICTLLGPKWDNAAPIFAGFTLVALYIPVGSVVGWLLTSQGRGRDFLTQSSISSFLAVVSFLIGLPFGPVGVAVSYSAYCLLIALPIGYYIAGRRGPVTTRDLWSRFFTYLPLWGVVCGATFLVYRLVPTLRPWAEVMVCGSAGFLVGAVFIFVYPPTRRTALELFALVKNWRAIGSNA